MVLPCINDSMLYEHKMNVHLGLGKNQGFFFGILGESSFFWLARQGGAEVRITDLSSFWMTGLVIIWKPDLVFILHDILDDWGMRMIYFLYGKCLL